MVAQQYKSDEEMIVHRSYTHNLSSCEIKAWKKIQVWTGFQPMISAVLVQCSNNWAIKPSGRWSNKCMKVNANEYMKDHMFESRETN